MTPGAEPLGGCVLDASVVVRWLTPETGWEDAVALIEDEPRAWIAPRLLLSEVAGAISRKVQGRKLRPETGAKAVNAFIVALDDGFVQLVEDEQLIGNAYLLSIDLAHRVPDCLYLALAEREGAALATADIKLAALASKRNVSVFSVRAAP